jgi:hypothetical protein
MTTISQTETICASTNIFATNVATVKNVASDWGVGHAISLEFRITPGGAGTAGLVLNYLPDGTYTAVVADINTGSLRVLRFNGTAFVTEFIASFAEFDFVFNINRWHKITATPIINSSNNIINVFGQLSDLPGTRTLAFATSVANYGPLIGVPGIFADRTYAYFNKLQIA